MKFHLYADDIQLYLSFNGHDPHSEQEALNQLESCISDIKLWMMQNKLKLKDSKTEFLQFLSSPVTTNSTRGSMTSISIGDDNIFPRGSAKNLGVIMDDRLSLNNHIMFICKAANFQLFKLSRIRKYLTLEALRIADHALILVFL